VVDYLSATAAGMTRAGISCSACGAAEETAMDVLKHSRIPRGMSCRAREFSFVRESLAVAAAAAGGHLGGRQEYARCAARPADQTWRRHGRGVECFPRMPGMQTISRPIRKKSQGQPAREGKDGVHARRMATRKRTGMCSSAPSSRAVVASPRSARTPCSTRSRAPGSWPSRPRKGSQAAKCPD